MRGSRQCAQESKIHGEEEKKSFAVAGNRRNPLRNRPYPPLHSTVTHPRGGATHRQVQDLSWPEGDGEAHPSALPDERRDYERREDDPHFDGRGPSGRLDPPRDGVLPDYCGRRRDHRACPDGRAPEELEEAPCSEGQARGDNSRLPGSDEAHSQHTEEDLETR